jgi:hypothetical protein
MEEGSPILSSGSFSDLIKAVLSTKSSIFLYKSGNNKALLDKKSLTGRDPRPCVHCLQAKPFYALRVIKILTNL